jgi:hypothetical protein
MISTTYLNPRSPVLRIFLYQLSMLLVDPDELGLAPDAFERHLPDIVRRMLSREDFDGIWAPTRRGAPTWCPLSLTAMLALQYRYNVSDRDLVERCWRDLAWRHAIGLEHGKRPPSVRSVQRFRSKLLDAKGNDYLMRLTLELARSEDLIGDARMQGMDSTNTDCRGAIIDTFNLVAAAIGQVVKKVARCLGRRAEDLAKQWELERYLSRSIKGRVSIDWSDAAARNALITEEIRDADRLPELVAGLGVVLPPDVQEALELLAQVSRQDVEELEGGTFAIARGTVSGRVISVTDAQARHGRKSSSKTINGFKTHVMGTLESQFVTGIVVTDAGVHDAKPSTELIEQGDTHGLEPGEAVADAAYGTGANVRACEQLGVDILTRQATVSRPGGLAKRDFAIDLDRMGADGGDMPGWPEHRPTYHGVAGQGVQPPGGEVPLRQADLPGLWAQECLQQPDRGRREPHHRAQRPRA